MKKFAVKMLMLVMAFALSQTALADSKDKKDKGNQATEHRGYGYGHGKKGEHPQWGMNHPGKHHGLDMAKWDSIRAAHRDAMQQKRDSFMAAHPDFKQKRDSLIAAHRGFKLKRDSLKHGDSHKFRRAPMMKHVRRFRHHVPFGYRMFAHRPHGFHRSDAEVMPTVEAEVKAADVETTAITKVSQSKDAPAYDLQGRQLTGQQGKGIIVRNGKKYVSAQ